MKTVGLLGTKFTMEEDFYTGRLKRNFNIGTLIPAEEERAMVNDIIYNELCLGVFKDTSRMALKKIIQSLVNRGAEGIILGCTEIPLLIKEKDSPVPLFNTTEIHSLAAVRMALG